MICFHSFLLAGSRNHFMEVLDYGLMRYTHTIEGGHFLWWRKLLINGELERATGVTLGVAFLCLLDGVSVLACDLPRLKASRSLIMES